MFKSFLDMFKVLLLALTLSITLRILYFIFICENFSVQNEAFREFDLGSVKENDSVNIEIINNIENYNKNNTKSKIYIEGCLNINRNSYISQISERIFVKIFYKETLLYSECNKVLSSMKYFPVAFEGKDEEFQYENTWHMKRTYGGDRRHEGTDIMSNNDINGYHPIVSVSDGIVENIGWLKLGGWRIGIKTNEGVYYYYAHLHSYVPDLKKGDEVKAGQLIGFMGNTGYSDIEGTKGKFDIHLHFGVYLYDLNKEISINPYFLLKKFEKIKIYYKYCK